jgi:hypothetical protein
MDIIANLTKLQAEYNEQERIEQEAHERKMTIKATMRSLLTIEKNTAKKVSKVLNNGS